MHFPPNYDIHCAPLCPVNVDIGPLLAIEPCPLPFRTFAFLAWRLHFDQEDPRRALLTSRILPPHLHGRLVLRQPDVDRVTKQTVTSAPKLSVRNPCRVCSRSGRYHLVSLTAKYGPEISLRDHVDFLFFDCLGAPRRDRRRASRVAASICRTLSNRARGTRRRGRRSCGSSRKTSFST